jgi:excisionase family DNA binding protein
MGIIEMNKELYTIDQVAQRLQLHVKTVRRYVREGRLKATRIGKQYRIAAEDLAEFSGGQVEVNAEPVRTSRSVDATTVVEISAISPELSSRLSNSLMAAMKGVSDSPAGRIDTIYYEETGKLKVILHGNLLFTAELLRMIDVLLDHDFEP